MHPMLPSQGQYSQFPAFTHNSFHLGFHRNSQGLNIQQPNYSLYPVDQPPLLYQSFTSSQSMMMSDLTSYQRNSSFSHGPSPSQTYPVSYGGGSSSSDMSGFLPLNQQTAYNETVTPGDSSMSAFIPEASAGQLQASSESRTDESSRSSESAYNCYKILCHLIISHTTSVGMTLPLVSFFLFLILIIILATKLSGYSSRTSSSNAMKLSG